MSLRSTLDGLAAAAEVRAFRGGGRGEASAVLKGGAALTLRAEGRRRQLIVGREGAPVGEVEILVFRRDGQVPPDAARADYQRDAWHYVALSWELPPPLWERLPEEELPEWL